MMGELIDINSSSFPFESQSELVYPGTWYMYGSIDGLNSFTKRTLNAPFDVFQKDYNAGFDHGTWSRQYLFQTSP